MEFAAPQEAECVPLVVDRTTTGAWEPVQEYSPSTVNGLRHVFPQSGRSVRVIWSDGSEEDFDLSVIFAGHRQFLRVRSDEQLFRAVRVDVQGRYIEWPDGSLIVAERLAMLRELEMSNATFREAMATLDISYDGMAQLLGLSRRQVAAMRGKAYPAPRSAGRPLHSSHACGSI